MKLDHLGYACTDIEEALQYLRMEGCVITAISNITSGNLNGTFSCFVDFSDGGKAELVWGTDITPIKPYPLSLLFVCYEVDNIHHTTVQYQNKGAVELLPPTPEVTLNNRLVSFLSTPSGLIKLVEKLELYSDATLEEISEDKRLIPASYNQQWLWLLDSLASTSWYYNMPLALKIYGSFNIMAFREAIETLVKRHDSLRTVFRNKDGTIYRLILEQYNLPFSVVKANQWSEKEIDTQVAYDAKTKFLLSDNELLFKVRILQFKKDYHLLLLTMHHSIFDGFSYDIFFTELEDLYEHYCYAKPSKLEPITESYSDYVNWQKKLLTNPEVSSKHLLFWKQQLENVPLLQFPTDYTRPLQQTYEGKFAKFTLEQSTVGDLYNFAKKHKTSPFMICLSVFYVLLARYSNQVDFAFGVPIAGRLNAKMEKVIGYFTNIFALRINSKDSVTFSELLEHVKELLFQIYEHQDIPFGKVVEQLNIKRDLSRNPIFQILFAYQNIGVKKLSLPQTEIQSYREGYDAARFDFTFEIEDRKNSIQGGVYYNTALFSQETIEYLIDSFKEILNAFILNPESKLAHFSLTNPSKQLAFITQTNHYTYVPTNNTFIKSLFEKQVLLYPSQLAVQYENFKISYDELNQRATQLVNFLYAKGFDKGTRIAIGTGRCLELIIGIMACFKAGFVFIPLDPEYPVARLKWITQDAKVATILTHTQHASVFKDFDIPSINLEKEWQEIGLCSAIPQKDSTLTPNETAYIFYTSGSTGTPKGSLISQYNIVNLLESGKTLFDFHPHDKVLLFHSYAFDVALWEIFSALCFGASLVIPTKDNIHSIQQFYELLTKEQITVLNETPSAFEQLLIYAKTVAQQKLQLRYVILAGEALKPKILEDWFTIYDYKKCQVINMYGITETTVYSTYMPVTPAMIKSGRSIIGTGIPGVTLYIMDQNQNLLPPHVIGEIFVSGHGVGQGYLNSPKLTEQRFIPDPFSHDNKLMYRTGDIGKYLPNGDIEYLGRIDNQIKIRGYRVELEEIELILISHPQVSEVVTHVQRDSSNEHNAQLIAFVISKDTTPSPLLKAELQSILESKVPHYMWAQIVFLKQFPLMINGKIDKNQLPKIQYTPENTAAKKPNSSLEIEITQLWKEILNIEIENIDTNFFDMGGNSLFAMQLHSKLLSRFSCDLKIADLFNYASIRKLAEFIDKKLITKPPIQPISNSPEKPPVLNYTPHAIAIIGMAGKFPGAENIESFWENLKNGIDSISRYSKQELLELGVPESLLAQDSFVGASGTIQNIDLFDSEFFNLTPKEAELTDPQHRIFLETAHLALENAGYAPSKYNGSIAVYAGTGDSDYLYGLLASQKFNGFQASSLMLRLANEKDYLTTKVAYKLGLNGPAVNINNACSTSLVSIIKACQSLLAGEANIALAGGVSLILPRDTGYLCELGSIFSKDGVCKAFDQSSSGTVPASGVGIVVLKKLIEAIEDGDTIHAVITGYALNNDSNNKVSFSAPSVQGQVDCIRKALSSAKINPKEISYIETHGTGTTIGDPIEIQALTEVFRERTDREAFCAIGSVKNNIGHTQSAAGVAGLIKTIGVLKEKLVPPHINYKKPNVMLDLESSPFLINTQERRLKGNIVSAAVSSFGIGGTNAHVILQSYTGLTTHAPSEPFKLIVLSAKSPEALNNYRMLLKAFLQQKTSLNSPSYLDDFAYTLQVGREEFAYRQAWICEDIFDAITQLDKQSLKIVCNPAPQDENFVRLHTAAEKWISGEVVDWKKLHKHKRNRIPVPKYPFIHKSYWHESLRKPNSDSSSEKVSVIPQRVVITKQKLSPEHLQQNFLQIMAEALGYDQIKLSDNFFDLGGDSLIAINVASRIESELGLKMSFNDISNTKNIGSIIQGITQANHGNKGEMLKKLKEASNPSLPSIFIIHPGNGSLFHYENLVSEIEYPGAIWGIENSIFERSYRPFNSVEDMATHYISLIKRIQKTGPYLFAGWSLGASVGFEMVRQLELKGESVKNITLIDGWYKYNPLLDTDDFFYNLHAKDFEDFEEGKRNLLLNLLRTRFKLFMDYHPKPIQMGVTLIKAKELSEEFNVTDTYNNWGCFVPKGIELFMAEGDHLTLLSKQNVRVVANAYNQVLKKALLEIYNSNKSK